MFRSDTHRKFPFLIAVAFWSVIVSFTPRPCLFVANKSISTKLAVFLYILRKYVMLKLALPDYKVYDNKALSNEVENQH